VALALDQLGRGARGPDGLADPPGVAAAVGDGDEVAPGRDDAGRVGSDVGHVGERDQVGVAAEGRPQQPDLGRAHHHQDRLAGGDAVADEGEGPGQEADLAVVQQRLVPEGRPHLAPPDRVEVEAAARASLEVLAELVAGGEADDAGGRAGDLGPVRRRRPDPGGHTAPPGKTSKRTTVNNGAWRSTRW
jgi:hypothetical protein